ncbi:hypothetical protein BDP55DRAFT_732639 [Colletotrichum godetiae]|uniref:Uncharacterized protein n=1 Tax=Colletotrichum godetiae TaxID=1209918 RepID=A0AAJ0ABX3_9PEZI|nr:uncharacterized protein BDP55DRAFT_732639 [Colletotrichum godetiae]KAK1671029.1 hypothetical protein BDP55DRAFT_732639 [Colletotrichum godetiae]
MRDKNLRKLAKCVLPYKEQNERQETYELMPLPGPAPDPNLHKFEEVPIKIKSKRVRFIRRLTKQPRLYKRVPVPNPTFLQFARLPDKIKSKIWREFYLEPRYYIAELHPKDDEIEGEDYDWEFKSCDGESSGEEPFEESTPKENSPKESIPEEKIPEENVSKKSTPEGSTSNIGTPQTDALNTNDPKGQPYDEYLSDEYSSEEDEAAEDEVAEDGTDVNGAAAAENGVVEHGAAEDTTINDLFDELGPDEADDKIDNVEGRDSTDLPIWPSSNSTEPLNEEDEEDEEADKPTHRAVFWTLSRHDAEYSNGYYDSIDTTIDVLSRPVAQSVRPRFWFSTFVQDELEEGEEGPWMPIPPPKDSSAETGEIVSINWDIDFVHVKVRFRTCVPESIDWMQNIQNLVIDTKPFIARRPQHVTDTCFWMWTNKATLSNLKSIRQIAAPEYQVPFWHTEWCHYQMRHLLRFAPGTPPQWRNIQSELVSDEFWVPPDSLPRQP